MTVSIIIIPKVETPSPAVESKMLALRMLLVAIFALGLANWETLKAPRRQFVDILFAGLIGSFLLSTLFSGRIRYCIVESWHTGGLFILGWLVYRMRPGIKECGTLVRIGGLLGLLAGLYGFLAFIGYDVLAKLYPFSFEETQAGGRNFIHSFFGNPEYFGGFAAPTAALLLGLGLQPGINVFRRAGWIIGSGFILGVLALSGSRGAFLGFLAGAVIIFFSQIGFLTRKMQKVCWAATVLAILGFLSGLIILSTPNPLNPRDMRLVQRFEDVTNTRSDSIRERILFYTSTAMAIPENPVFGFGPGTYRLEFFNNVKLLVEKDHRGGTVVLLEELKRRLAEHTHNDFLEFWFEQGTIGFALLLLLIIHASVRFLKVRWLVRRKATGMTLTRPAALYTTIFAAVVTIFINALTSFPLHMPARGILAWTLIGAFFAMDFTMTRALENPTGEKPDSLITEKDEK